MRSVKLVACCVCSLFVAACSAGQHVVATALPPGNAIVSYPNSVDQNWTTVFFSQPSALLAGVDGRALTIRIFDRQQPVNDALTLDINGDLGLHGVISTRSSRNEKKDIRLYQDDAAKLIDRVQMVSYRYKSEPDSAQPHVGFIAEDTPIEFTGPRHSAFNLNNSIAINMAATQELHRQIQTLQRQVADLEREVQAFRRNR